MRRHLAGKKPWLIILSICLMVISPIGSFNVHGNESTDNTESAPKASSSFLDHVERNTLYSHVLQQWQTAGIGDVQGTEIRIGADQYTNAADGTTIQQDELQGKSNSLLIQEKGWAEYVFDAPSSGLYHLNLNYLPLQESNIPIQIKIYIDGEIPYREAEIIELDRMWKDKFFPPNKDERGNEMRSPQEGILQWSERPLRDSVYGDNEPLRWHLDAGQHTIRIETKFEPIALSQLTFTSPIEIQSYEDARASYPSEATTADPNWFTIIEAEQMEMKSIPSVQIQASRDDLAVPNSNGKITYNTMGGDRWNRGGQWAEWTFEVPEDGMYHLHLKYFQGYYKGIDTFREIKIDGKVPFKELLAYPFSYSRYWQEEALHSSSGDGDPFLFYFEKGTHTLTMSVTSSPLTPVLEALQDLLTRIQTMNRVIRLVTGASDKDYVDKNRDWNLVHYVPDIKEQFEDMKQTLGRHLDYLQELYGNNVDGASAIRSAIDRFGKLALDPNELPFKPELLSAVQESLSAYSIDLAKQPLMLDQIYVAASEAKLPAIAPSKIDVLFNMVKTFFLTFSPDYFDYGRQDEDATITVWVNRGRDYVALMQQMVDEMFTPSTDIKVNVNIMPNPQLLILSNAAGREPDVALGLDQLTPVDFAIRNALLNLNQFDDYRQVANQFHPGAMIPFNYNSGDYALPETILFNIMFYRTDILEELNMQIPQTWTDVIDALPTLQQNGYDFFMQPLLYLPLIYQNNVSFYTPNGLKTGLDTPQAFNAFKQWTDLFNIYGLPRDVPNFYMHFRNGDMPIGISDYNTYLQLLVAAPEISGSWEIAPIPGTVNDEGVTERWGGGGLQAGVIFKSTENPQESWEFLKWWTSTEVQSRFGNDLEMFNGIEFRWNTANLEAFQRLPWPTEHQEQIMEQYKWFKEMPNVPGGYFTTRELIFAWNRTVLEEVNFRESLEKSVFEINRELLRKQQEFGFVDENGNIVRELQIPQVDKPWEGGE